MSRSPLEASAAAPPVYTNAWEAVHRMVREGLSWSGNERDVALGNDGTGRFVDISATSGLDALRDGRAAAWTDVDGDGGLDLWTMSRDGARLRLLHNRARRGNWLRVSLVGTGGNRDAIGARVEVRPAGEGPARVRTLRAGHGYLAQSSKVLHFGLGAVSRIESVRVTWPDGALETFSGCAANTHVRLVRDAGSASLVEPTASVAPTESPAPAPHLPTSNRVVLATTIAAPPLPAHTMGGLELDASQVAQRARLVVLWASWCAPCRAEIADLVEARERLAAAGLEVLLLHADPAEDKGELDAFLRQAGWPFAVARATPAALDALDQLQQYVLERRRRLALPSSFLIDPEGRISAFYRGRVDPALLVGDALFAASTPTAVQRRDHAVPFPGRWLGPPGTPDALSFEARLRSEGFDELADAYYPRALAHDATMDTSRARTHLELGLARLSQRRLEEAERQFRAALALDPELAEAWAALAPILHRRGDLDEALAAYARALALRPDDDRVRFNHGVGQLDAGDLEGLRTTIEKLEVGSKALADRLRELARQREEARAGEGL